MKALRMKLIYWQGRGRTTVTRLGRGSENIELPAVTLGEWLSILSKAQLFLVT